MTADDDKHDRAPDTSYPSRGDSRPIRAQRGCRRSARGGYLNRQQPRSFDVEDMIRPLPPPNLTYEPQSHSTCKEVWSAVDGQPLEALFDGTRLSVDMAKVEPRIEMFEVDRNNKISGCRGLKGAKASRTLTTYTRP